MKDLPLILVVVAVIALLLLARRSRAKIAAREQATRSQISVGSEVMTTSGLYGRVVGINDDDSVQLAIAPGVEVRWTMAALRPIETLPPRYRGETPGESSGRAPDDDPPDPTP